MTLSVSSLKKSFPGERVLREVTFEVADGEFCVVVGPSGCGKSTLLKAIAGLVAPDAGEVSLGGTDLAGVPVERRDLAFVFQDFEERLFPHLTVEENVLFGLEHDETDRSEAERDRLVTEALELLAIPETRDDSPEELSGGQQQRVELARQLVRECETMLLDDPLSDLDYKLQKRMELELRRIHADRGSTVVYVTHNQDQALKLGDKVVVLNDGLVEQVGTPTEVYERPATAFVGRFIGDSTVLPGEPTAVPVDGEPVAVETHAGTVTARAAGDPRADEAGLVLVRPTHTTIGGTPADVDADNVVTGTLEERIYTGEETEFVVTTERTADEFAVRRPGNVAPADVGTELGGRAAVGWDAADATYFDERQFSVSDAVTLEDLKQL